MRNKRQLKLKEIDISQASPFEYKEKKGFEGLGHEYYLVYELDTSKSADYPNLPAINRGPQTTKPFFATWSELME